MDQDDTSILDLINELDDKSDEEREKLKTETIKTEEIEEIENEGVIGFGEEQEDDGPEAIPLGYNVMPTCPEKTNAEASPKAHFALPTATMPEIDLELDKNEIDPIPPIPEVNNSFDTEVF